MVSTVDIVFCSKDISKYALGQNIEEDIWNGSRYQKMKFHVITAILTTLGENI